MQGITPCLWFDGNAEDAVNYYISVIPDSRINHISRYPEAAAKASGNEAGSVMTIGFELNGQPFLALNGGPHYKFTPAVSFMLFCDTQDQVDTFWEKLSDGGKTKNCGWLTDRFGISWQIVPSIFHKIMADPDISKTDRFMGAVLTMDKLNIKALEEACNAPSATGSQPKENA